MNDLLELTSALLSWWDSGHSHWPWRESQDPYAIWVAEVMLQQTQIATVLPYYDRWMNRFPTVKDLAEASLDEVLKLWEGLGYYSRARNLHAAAMTVNSQHHGKMPRTVEDLLALKGIGPYTAGAVASIAFGVPAAAVDGNVIRVLSRLFDMNDDVGKVAARREIWALAERLLDRERPGDFNQALMELGQLICLPKHPACDGCPMTDLCLARIRGTQMERPVRKRRKEIPHYQVTAGIICRGDGQFLIAKRPTNGLLGGLWEFPGGKQEEGESLEEALRREILEEMGIDIEVGRRLLVVKHAYSHFRITLHAFLALHQQGEPQNLEIADHSWVNLGDLERYAFASADRKIIDYLHAQSVSNADQPCAASE